MKPEFDNSVVTMVELFNTIMAEVVTGDKKSHCHPEERNYHFYHMATSIVTMVGINILISPLYYMFPLEKKRKEKSFNANV